MKQLVYLLAAFCITSSTIAQSTARKLKKTIVLQMALTAEDDMPGTRGASVVWHPLQKKYYAAMAGNVGYPLSVFDATSKRVSADTHITDADIRGLWYNPFVKAIQGNQYNDYGWFQYKLTPGGMVDEVEELQEGMHQPDAQSAGAYYPAKKQVLFQQEGAILFYNYDTGLLEEDDDGEAISLKIFWGLKKSQAEEDQLDSPEGLYNSTVIFTGIKGGELGFLNVDDRQIELYDIKTGYLSQALAIPDDAKAELTFNFAFANGMYWLFDMETRKWTGYK
jgi:hypothetical protein